MTNHRIRITIRRDATGAHMLSMARTTPPWHLGAYRQTRAECETVARHAMAAFGRDDIRDACSDHARAEFWWRHEPDAAQ